MMITDYDYDNSVDDDIDDFVVVRLRIKKIQFYQVTSHLGWGYSQVSQRCHHRFWMCLKCAVVYEYRGDLVWGGGKNSRGCDVPAVSQAMSRR